MRLDPNQRAGLPRDPAHLGRTRRDASARPVRQAGFSLVETMIAVAIFVVGLLGVAALVSSTLRTSKHAEGRAVAIVLANDLGERISANKAQAMLGAYALSAFTGTPAATKDCAAVPCTAVELTAFDKAQWQTLVASSLQKGSATVTAAGTNPVTYSIDLQWNERRIDSMFKTVSGAGISFQEPIHYTTTKLVMP